ncbi:MAG TPA: hypothetical protein VMZ06_03875 [Candidatus Bathyarchaeia archaeon]|nr:hypothetical protein [Candidatus Bathyarchaeia archaeon]
MNISIDNVAFSGLTEEPRDVLEAVAAVSDYVRTRGRAVMSVRVNGAHVAPDALVETLRSKTAADVATLEITTEDIKSLVDNALTELEQVLPDLPQVCRRLAEVFQSEDPDSGYDPFHQLAAIWKTVKERQIQVASALDIDLNSAVVDGKPIAEHHAELNTLLAEAAEGIQKGDCVTLGDLLEHELPHRAEMEARIVGMLRSRAQGGRG